MAPTNPQTDPQGFKRVGNTSFAEALNRKVYAVISLDISGSMSLDIGGLTACDRKTGEPCSRIRAALDDARMYASQLIGGMQMYRLDLLLFGQTLHTHPNITSLEAFDQAIRGVEYRLEGGTRLDLALEYANKAFESLKSQPPPPDYVDPGAAAAAAAPQPTVTFFNLVLTDGAPSFPGLNTDQIRDNIAKILIKGMEPMTSDLDRGTSFIRYGSSPDVVAFMQFLDDELKDRALAYFRQIYPANPDVLRLVHDYVDTGAQCQTWRDKGMRASFKVDPRSRWDDDIKAIVAVSLAD